MSVATATELWRLSATEPAVEAAKAADRAVAYGDPLPFHGVPFTVKGNIDLVGTPATHGAKALVGAHPTLDAPAVERLKAAGAIPIGHTNLPTFALRWHTDSELYGPTINPWDRSRTRQAHPGGPGGRPGRSGHRHPGPGRGSQGGHALEDAGYAVQEVQPLSIDTAAKILLDMLNTPDIRAMWRWVRR